VSKTRIRLARLVSDIITDMLPESVDLMPGKYPIFSSVHKLETKI
jgi:hypothetical protein